MGAIHSFLIAIQLISVFIYSIIVSMCKHCWQLIIRYDYKKLIRRCCLVKLLMKCVQCIADKMKCLRDISANLHQQQQEGDTYIAISPPIQATDEQ